MVLQGTNTNSEWKQFRFVVVVVGENANDLFAKSIKHSISIRKLWTVHYQLPLAIAPIRWFYKSIKLDDDGSKVLLFRLQRISYSSFLFQIK